MAETGTTGDWAGAAKRIEEFVKRRRERVTKALEQNALMLRDAIKEGIISQAPGGVPFAPLSGFTILMRLGGGGSGPTRRGGQGGADGGGHKALLNHGDLLGSIQLLGDGMSARVGVNRNAKARNGQPMTNIAKVLTEGRVISVTSKMRGWFKWAGHPLKPSTTHIVIPPRPFIEPVYRAKLGELKARFAAALKEP